MIIDNHLFREEIPEKGASRGHIRFHLKSKEPSDVSLVGFCANLAATLLFERLQAQGTNIIITIDKRDARCDVLARHENDGVELIWTPKQFDPAQYNDAQERIKNKTFFIGKEPDVQTTAKTGTVPASRDHSTDRMDDAPDSAQQILVTEKKDQPRGEDPELTEEQENHLIKQLHRVP
jgi:hypothetical protein